VSRKAELAAAENPLRKSHISNEFEPSISLTLPKTRAYTQHVTSRALFAARLLAAAVLLTPVTPHAQAIQRMMYVSALDEAGAPVTGLGPSDFMVREDNAPREVLRVGPADDPMQVAILVDNSQAARSYISDIRNGLEGFVTDMTNGTKHELSITALAERPTNLASPSNDRAQLLKGVYRIFEQRGSGNYLLDGLIEISKGYAKREARRPVFVVVTSEGPELSSRRWEDALKPVHDIGAALHVIVLGPPSNDISEDARNRSMVLDEGPRSTGGRRDSLLASSALPGALKKLAAELNAQYKVTYARPQSLIPPEKVTVAAARPGFTARGTLIQEKREQAKP
jgi:hypothetical protein